jgi:hypothetical protein
MSNCTVLYCYAEFGSGDGIWNKFGASLMLSCSTVQGCSASADAGGILNSGNLSLDGCNIVGNTASRYGGGIVNTSGASLSIAGSSLVTDNTANGYDPDDATAVARGGGIYNMGTPTMSDSSLGDATSGNHATGTGSIRGRPVQRGWHGNSDELYDQHAEYGKRRCEVLEHRPRDGYS